MRPIKEKILFEGEWITFVRIDYSDGKNNEHIWECVKRNKEVRAAVVVAKLTPSNRFIIIKQYRPVINGYILAFPAGLIQNDPAEALKELKEETGYTGRIVATSPLIKSNSGIVNDNGYVVYAQVDENDPANQHPQQELEPQEEIEVFLLKRDEIPDFFKKESSQGTYIGGNLWYLFVLSDLIR